MKAKKAAKPKKDGRTPPTQMRLGPDTKAHLLAIQAHYGLTSLSDAVRLAAKREVDRLKS